MQRLRALVLEQVRVDEVTTDEFFHQDPRRARGGRLRRPIFWRACCSAQSGGGRIREALADDRAPLHHAVDHHESGGVKLRSGEDPWPPSRDGSYWLVVSRSGFYLPHSLGVS